jgi:hypothetical protein
LDSTRQFLHPYWRELPGLASPPESRPGAFSRCAPLRTRFRKGDLLQYLANENMRLHRRQMLADDFAVDRQLKDRPGSCGVSASMMMVFNGRAFRRLVGKRGRRAGPEPGALPRPV